MGGRHAANRKAPENDQYRAEHPSSSGPPSGTDRADPESRPADAYEVLVEQHHASLLSYVLGLTRGNRDRAHEIVEETFRRVAEDPARFTQRAASVRAWLAVVARGVCDEGDRRPGARAGHAAVGPLTDRVDPAASTTILRAMDNLSGVHREILVELFYRGTSLEDAAAARGVPVETVKSRLYYAMRALRVVLDQQVP